MLFNWGVPSPMQRLKTGQLKIGQVRPLVDK